MIIGKKYELLELLGKGSFGETYKAINIRTRGMVALKRELLSEDTKMLKYETKIYQYLSGLKGIPQVIWFGVDNKNFYMAITLLGNSLNWVLSNYKPFSLEVTKSSIVNMVKILESVHKMGIIHRDVKPDNFLFGVDKNAEDLYLIDFGLCKKYTTREDGGGHIAIRRGRPITGTPNYVSVNVHNGLEPSRRDDLESVSYIMLFMFLGYLPWENETDSAVLRESKIETMKGAIIPKEIRCFNKYCRELAFEEAPDYEYIYNLMNIKKIDSI